MTGLRLPTLGPLVDSSRRTALRFPLVLASGVLAAWAGITLAEGLGDDEQYVRLGAAAALGLPLFFALTLFAERRPGQAWARWVLFGAGAAALALFWAVWPQWTESVKAARFFQLSAVLHLLVAFLPYAGFSEPNGFWYYNKALFLRFLTAALYSAVLFAGLAIAFAALDKLLGLDVPEEGYLRLWIVMAFVLNTWLFVGGVPEDLPGLEARRDYPEGLRVFTQYVLLPIVVIYLVILTVYFAKVMVTREWPSGWIGYLVSSVAVVGILSWLLVRPLEDFAEHAWVKSYTRGFYLAIMPAIVMLWLAIGKRVGQYGITERRYFLIVLSLWLAGIAVYYTVRRTRNIMIIPASLCVLGLMTFFGPWGAYAVSRRSQTGRLETLLTTYGVLSGGTVQRASREIPVGDRRQVSAALQYLVGTHGVKALPAWIGDSVVKAIERGAGARTYQATEYRVRAIMDWLAIGYVASYQGDRGLQWFAYNGSISEPEPIAGYQYAVVLDQRILQDSILVAEGAFLTYEHDAQRVLLKRRGRTLLEMSLRSLIEAAQAPRLTGPDRRQRPAFRLEARDGRAGMLALFTSLSGQVAGDTMTLRGMSAQVYVRLPND